MIGRRFALLLKREPESRKDFEALLLERRTEIHKQLESADDPKEMHRLQGEIRSLDKLASYIENVMNLKDEE